MLYRGCDLSIIDITNKEAKAKVRTVIYVLKTSLMTKETASYINWLKSVITNEGNGLPYYENHPDSDSDEGIKMAYDRLASLMQATV